MTAGHLLSGSAADAERIAALHADSWRRTYRGILSDAYLDGPVLDDRARFWRARLEVPAPGERVLIVPGEDGALDGFVCIAADKDARWGSLVDNLHVAKAAQGSGLGVTLLAAAARVARDIATTGGLYLWVYEANVGARRFYDRRGGTVVETITEEVPGGGSARVLRVAWTGAAREALGGQ